MMLKQTSTQRQFPHLHTHLKGAPQGKRERPLQVPLLCAPALPDLVVTNHHLLAALVEAWVDVEGNVVASQKIDGEPGKGIRGDGAAICVCSPCRTAICTFVCVLCRRGSRTEEGGSKLWLTF